MAGVAIEAKSEQNSFTRGDSKWLKTSADTVGFA